jgi:signal transduction histidine kinase/ActR/RegA family two-component response regulator
MNDAPAQKETSPAQQQWIRAEIWKVAADKSLSKEEIIQRLLDLTGQFLHVSRASYFEAQEGAGVMECTVQWCAPGMDFSIGEKLAVDIWKRLLQDAAGVPLRLVRSGLSDPLKKNLLDLFEKHRIKSLLAVPFEGETISFFSFGDCVNERQWEDLEIALVLEMTKIVSLRIDQIKTEAEKQALELQLRHSQTLEAIGQLAGGVAHDFNNILGAISGYAEMIKQKFTSQNPKLDKYTSAILSSSRRGAELTGQLLAFARKGRIQKVPVNVHELVSHISLLLQHSLDKKITVVLDLAAQNPFIIGDPTNMQNILMNLAMNARDAMPQGGTLTFTTANGELDDLLKKSHPEAMTGGYIHLSVRDTGVGMDDYTKTRLFEPFFTTKDIGKGVGLGLASVYGAVKSHNGFILVDSEMGRGTVATLFIPSYKTAALTSPGNAQGGLVRGSGNVLVVDNDEAIRAIYREMLTVMGYTVEIFDNGLSAIDYYKSHFGSVDMVILDMIMEGVNGMECFRELKKINPQIRAVLSSGYNFQAEQQDILREGIRCVIQKPFDSVKLSQAVGQALSGVDEG